MSKPTKEDLTEAQVGLDSAISALSAVALSLGALHPVSLAAFANIVALQRLYRKLSKELKA